MMRHFDLGELRQWLVELGRFIAAMGIVAAILSTIVILGG